MRQQARPSGQGGRGPHRRAKVERALNASLGALGVALLVTVLAGTSGAGRGPGTVAPAVVSYALGIAAFLSSLWGLLLVGFRSLPLMLVNTIAVLFLLSRTFVR